MRQVLAALAVRLAGAASAQTCLVEKLPAPNDTSQYDAMMRALMLAHAPIEYRKSCGLRDDSDRGFFEAIRLGVGCSDSAAYAQFMGGVLEEGGSYLVAVERTDLRSDEDFERYCSIVERIDLESAVKDDGKVNAAALRAQAPLFHAIQELIATRRWNN